MNEDRLRRDLALSVLDNLCLPVRKSIALSDWSYQDLVGKLDLRDLPVNEIESTVSWLSSSRENSLWYSHEDGFPSFEPIAQNNPLLLLCKGQRPVSGRKTVCMTATSRCDIRGLRKSFQLSLEAGLCSFDIVMALQDSCDFSILSGFNAVSGFCSTDARPIAVIGKGPDGPFSKTELFMQESVLASGGSLLFPFLCSHKRSPSDLKLRSLVMASLSTLVIAIQSPHSTHVIDTVDFALQMGRDVCTTGEGTGSGFNRAGTQRLAFDGAFVLDHFSQYLGKEYRIFDTTECRNVDFRYPYASFLSSAYCLKHKTLL